MSKLPSITGREVVRALERLGFQLSHVRGSHHYLFHPQKRVMVVVSIHAGKTSPPKILSQILKATKNQS